MKNRAYIVTLAVVVALMAASGASAKNTAASNGNRHSVAAHAAKHQGSRGVEVRVARRSGRHF